ncbi:nucleoporin-interacting protein [Aquibacillus salsiterrae]|uniref:Nucleoporin-interacting protein n=1 Tax=Aquibacillus salsiterrae TaxID=2950439 RepID=A0A9X3WEB7_9BACI|nr:nucleoporin-interacting protein [Aquibacillus salsiterrae]MDC3415864.1 nucleoporin-interacting protein [Aquibacillus salsiterrae]
MSKKRWSAGLIVTGIFTTGFMVLLTWLRYRYASSYARSWDQVDFALGVQSFDLFQMQPHFPGYPYFILGGTLVNQWIPNPAEALAYVNITLMTLAVIPIFLLCRRRLSVVYSLIGVVAVQSLAYLSIMTVEPMSGAAATAVLWWYIWSLVVAWEKNRSNPTRFSAIAELLPPLLFSILLGIRLSYFPFGLGFILLWIVHWKNVPNRRLFYDYLARQIIFTVVFQLIWIVGLVVSVGGVDFFVALAAGFIEGHFSNWGGAVTTDSQPVGNRFMKLIGENLVWVGMTLKSIFAAITFGLMIVVTAMTRSTPSSGRKSAPPMERWIIILSVGYFVWALLGQNVDKTRHILPLIGLIMLLLVLRLLASKFKKVAVVVVVLSSMLQVYQGYGYMKIGATERPSTYQLASRLEQLRQPFIVYTWEEERVLDYLNAPYDYKKIYTYELFLADISYRGNRDVYLTNMVVEGFLQQGHDVSDSIEEVDVFKSDPIFDPVYHTITLYKWTNNGVRGG